MRVGLALILLATSWAVAIASSDEATGRTLTQFADPGSGICPINYCKDQPSCMYNSRIKAWKCKACTAPRIPNKAQTECVCPAGSYPTASGGCVQCKLNFYCPLGTSATKSTAKACPANTVTLTKGSKSINDCYNAPGYRYLKTSSGVRAITCGDDEYSTGLKKQVACTKCMPGFVTDPTDPPGVHTSSAVCVAPPGYFVSGDSVAPCPKGEYNDDYSASTSCKLCEDAVAQGVTTEKEASTSKANCTYLEPGYAWVNDKKKVITGVYNPTTMTITGTKQCPQSFYCPGGDVTQTANAPTACPGGLWTEDEGAIAVDECVAPPGWYYNSTLLVECPQGTFKDTWDKTGLSSCKTCGTGLWLSDKNTFINKLDPNTGAVAQQIAVRGSSDSCYIQRGMGAILDRNFTTGESTIKAIVCPVDTYGVVGTLPQGDSVYKKYGQVVTPCTACPTNMKTGQFSDAQYAVSSYNAKSGDYSTTTVSINTTIGGYFDVKACANKDGYGYYAGSSQICPAGYTNIKGNKLPCTQCPLGFTTDFNNPINIDSTYCNMYIAGYGLVNGVTSKCLPGTYQTEQTPALPGGVACTACPTGTTTSGYGSTLPGDCNLCAPGYGTNGTGSCIPCGDGYYGPAGRDTTPCVACPTGRTYTYSWDGTDDVFTPLATSPYGAATTDDCVADFAQTVDGAFYLDLTAGAGYAVVPNFDNLASCVQYCRDTAACAAVTFDYNALVEGRRPCYAWTPNTQESFTTDGGVAIKVFPSTNLAKSKPNTKAMGNGQYTFWMDGSATGVPARIAAGSISGPVAGVNTLNACLDACTEKNLCVGVVFGAFTSPNTVASCKLIDATVQPGNSKRTLIKANFESFLNTLIVPPGFYTAPGSTIIQICNDAVVVDNAQAPAEVSYYCPGGVVGALGLRVGCGPVPAPGSFALGTPADAKSAADCWSILQAGYYSPTGAKSATVPCLADNYCLGGDIVFDAATTPAAAIGLTACPAGTDTAGVTVDSVYWFDSSACRVLNPNYYYNATADPGQISASSVLLCPAGSWCAGAAAITVGTSINPTLCPAGTSSAAGSYQEIDCTILLPTWFYDGTADISNTTVKTCPLNAYCPGAALTNSAAGGLVNCPGYTCVAANGNCTANANANGGNPGGSGTTGTGRSSVNDCINLDPGYYYVPGASYQISASVGNANTIRECPAGSYCSGAVNIASLRVQTGLTGTCPTGSTSTANSDVINDCINLSAGYYYAGGGDISTATILVCRPGSYCDGTTDISSPSVLATEQGITGCPAGTTCTAGIACTGVAACI